MVALEVGVVEEAADVAADVARLVGGAEALEGEDLETEEDLADAEAAVVSRLFFSTSRYLIAL